MHKPPKLTQMQKEKLAKLEPDLRRSVKLGNYNLAKQIAMDIQSILRSTGHETRLMQSKNWLFEAAMEAGEIETAIIGFYRYQEESFKKHKSISGSNGFACNLLSAEVGSYYC